MVMQVKLKQCSGIPVLQFLAALTADCSDLSSGMHYGWSSPAIPKLLSNDSEIPITQDQASWIATMLLCGVVLGSLLTGVLLDALGRKITIILGSIPFCISWLLIAFANNVWLLLLARFLAGVGDGLTQCSVPIYIGEITDPKIRGLFGTALSVTWFLGMVIINVIGSLLSIKTSALIAAVVPIVFIGTFAFMPDSPYYYLKKGNIIEAEKCIKKLTLENNASGVIKSMQDIISDEVKSDGKFWDLFTSPTNRKALFLITSLWTIQQASGLSPTMFYTQTIIEKSTANSFSPVVGSTLYFAMYVVFLSLCSFLVDKIGRKPLLIFSITGVGITLLIQSLYLSLHFEELPWVPLAAMIAYAIFFSFGLQSIPVLMQGELFDINIKAKAASVYNAYTAIISAVIFKLFQITSETFELYVPLFVFTGCCVFGLLYIIMVVPETKGKTLQEIQQVLGNAKAKNVLENTRL